MGLNLLVEPRKCRACVEGLDELDNKIVNAIKDNGSEMIIDVLFQMNKVKKKSKVVVNYEIRSIYEGEENDEQR